MGVDSLFYPLMSAFILVINVLKVAIEGPKRRTFRPIPMHADITYALFILGSS